MHTALYVGKLNLSIIGIYLDVTIFSPGDIPGNFKG